MNSTTENGDFTSRLHWPNMRHGHRLVIQTGVDVPTKYPATIGKSYTVKNIKFSLLEKIKCALLPCFDQVCCT